MPIAAGLAKMKKAENGVWGVGERETMEEERERGLRSIDNILSDFYRSHFFLI